MPPSLAPSMATPVMPQHLAQAVWRGHALGQAGGQVMPSGHAALDAELPGGGWPCHAMTEILQAPSAQAEWRLLGPVLAHMVQQGGSVLLIAPPYQPYLPGLSQEGLRADRLIRVDARTPSERLWATEQALKSACVCAVLSWLPQVRPEQIRRLHACAAQHPGLLFVFRPAQARSEASAAPLRLQLGLGPCPHPVQVQIIKRRGPMLARTLTLAHWPSGLLPLLPDASPPANSPSIEPLVHRPSHHAALDRPAAGGAHLIA